MMEEDVEFSEDFKIVFNNYDISEVDGFTPEVIEDIYVGMDKVLLRDGEGPKFSNVIKLIWSVNGSPIGRTHKNPMLDTRVYDAEYLDGNKASLGLKTFAEILYSQVDEAVNRIMLFDEKVDHQVDRTDTM